ncbi:MAG: ATP-binding cassette domain-containing protein, partial [Alistipes sp.]|nr:ATP-binding cassette domain-containing protein [Alistipes sp.]
VSPEMHRSYLKNIPAIDIVASGFFDTIGLYRTPTEEQRTECEAWMRCFGIEALRDRSFVKLSSGEQRLLLLARAFVKDPDLLILDEPLHGLDFRRKAIARSVIETFCERPGKTMIYVTHYENELPPCIDHKLTLHRIEE